MYEYLYYPFAHTTNHRVIMTDGSIATLLYAIRNDNRLTGCDDSMVYDTAKISPSMPRTTQMQAGVW